MSTRSNIGYQDKKTKEFHYVYCHFDGYVDGVGSDLLNGVPTYEDAKTLVDKGDMSSVGSSYASRGEDFEKIKPKVVSKIGDTFENEYSYVFVDNEWLVSSDGESFKSLWNLC